MFRQQALRQALQALGDTLADRDERFHIAIIGGSALLMHHRGTRPTGDVDVVAVAPGDDPLSSTHRLPPELAQAAQDVGVALGLDVDWLNTGALGVLSGNLPDGYEERLTSETFSNLIVSSVSRQDLIRLKVYAAADEGLGSVHVQDLVTLSITADELDDASAWVADRYPAGPIPELQEVVEQLWRFVR